MKSTFNHIKRSFFAILVNIASLSFAQTPIIQWQKCLGGSGSEGATSVQQTTDGGYIIAGGTNSTDGNVTELHGSEDAWIVKLYSNGEIQWEKTFGGTGYDGANLIQQTTDGGYIFAGGTTSNDGDVSGNHSIFGYDDIWVVKLDSNGNLKWQKCYGGSYEEDANSIQQTKDGGYIVAGITESNDSEVTGFHGTVNNGVYDYWILKLDSVGSLQWQKCLGGSADDEAESIQQTADGGYIVIGYTTSIDYDLTGRSNFQSADYWLVKLDSTGEIIWEKWYGGSELDEGYSVQQTFDKGYILAGFTRSNDGDVTLNHDTVHAEGALTSDYWVVKTDSMGNLQRQKSLGGSWPDEASYVRQTFDGGYIVAGSTASDNGDVTNLHGGTVIYGGPPDYWIVKLDSALNLQWQKCLGGSVEDGAECIQQTEDRGYIVAGGTNSNDGDVSGYHGDGDYWVVKLMPAPSGISENNLSDNNLSLYPNPVIDNEITFTYNVSSTSGVTTIFNVEGQEVAHYALPQWSSVQHITLPAISSGLYLARLTQGNATATVKFLKE